MRTVESFQNVFRSVVVYLTPFVVGVAIAGCGGDSGPELASVTGTVTEGGKPLVGADVTFMPEGEGAPSAGTTDESGKFELKYSDGSPGAVPGKHQVVITAMPDSGGMQGPPPEPDGTEPEETLEAMEEPEMAASEPIECYKQAEVKSGGENDFTFEVEE